MTVARALPFIVNDNELSDLEVEVRFQKQQAKHLEKNSVSVAQYWKLVEETDRVPILIRLVRAILILPHGNAEVERTFSHISGILTKKRTSLGPHTIKAFVVSKSVLSLRKWNSANIPITNFLLKKVADSHAAYLARVRKAQLDEAEKVRQENEKTLREELEREKQVPNSIRNCRTTLSIILLR